MQISAYQHIYSNVPKEQSPSGRRGYQTLLYSHEGLSREDVLALEEKAQYYSSPAEPVKRQFFTLPDGRAVVSQTVPLPEPDEFGRKGRYLSHSLIISAEDFAALDYCPALLFSSRHFFIRPEEALSAGQRGSDIPPRVLPVSDGWQATILQMATDWPKEQLLALARLGWQAAHLKTERQAVALEGAPEEIMRTMALLSLLVPPDKRPLLTFDSYAYGCDWSRDWSFWGWGGLGEERHKAAYLVNCETHTVTPAVAPRPETPYERWLVEQISSGNWTRFLDDAPAAWQLDRYFQGKTKELPLQVDEKLGRFFAQMNLDNIVKRVLSCMPQGLSPQTARHIQANVADDPWGYLAWANQSPTAAEVAEVLNGLLLQNFRSPPPEGDRKLLLKLAKESKHAGLAAILQLQAGDTAGWQNSLDSLSNDNYQEQVELALNNRLVLRSDAFSVQHWRQWLQEFASQMQPGEVDGLLKRWRKLKGKFQFDNLLGLERYLVERDRRALAYWLDKEKINAPRLRSALGVPPKPTWLQRMSKWLPKRSKGRKRGA